VAISFMAAPIHVSLVPSALYLEFSPCQIILLQQFLNPKLTSLLSSLCLVGEKLWVLVL